MSRFGLLALLFSRSVWADGTCQAALAPFTGDANFTLSIHALNGWVSYSSGRLRPEQSVVVSQFFSNRLEGGRPFSSGNTDRLGLLLSATRSQLETTLVTWGNGKATFDLLCGAGQSGPNDGSSVIVRGVSGGQELSLLLTRTTISTSVGPKPVPSRATAPPLPNPSGEERADGVQQVPYPPEFGSRRDVARSAEIALDALGRLSSSDPNWITAYTTGEPRDVPQEVLNLRLRWIAKLAAVVTAPW